MYICIYMYIYVYIYVYNYMYIYVYICIYILFISSVYMQERMFAGTYVFRPILAKRDPDKSGTIFILYTPSRFAGTILC